MKLSDNEKKEWHVKAADAQRSRVLHGVEKPLQYRPLVRSAPLNSLALSVGILGDTQSARLALANSEDVWSSMPKLRSLMRAEAKGHGVEEANAGCVSAAAFSHALYNLSASLRSASLCAAPVAHPFLQAEQFESPSAAL